MTDEDRLSYWESIYQNERLTVSANRWAVDELRNHPDCRTVLELGCGRGYLSESLAEAGYAVVATDLSPTAISEVRRRARNVRASVADHSEPLPFEDGMFDAVIADLSLHYFDAATTTRIIGEIGRVLRPSGRLLARVNSFRDVNHGAGTGEEIEPGFFRHHGHFKRFFDEAMVRLFLDGWEVYQVDHREIFRGGPPKWVYQIGATPAATRRRRTTRSLRSPNS